MTAVLRSERALESFRRVWKDRPVLVDPDFAVPEPLSVWSVLDPAAYLGAARAVATVGVGTTADVQDSGGGAVVRIRDGQVAWTWRQTSFTEPTDETIALCDAGKCPEDTPMIRACMTLLLAATLLLSRRSS